MDSTALLRLAAGGENSRVQFKVNMTNAVSIAQEIVAFSNSKGGILLIGIDDKTGEVVGLSLDKEELSRLLQSSGNLYAEQMILQQSTTKDIDWGLFREFYEKKYKEEISHEEFAAKVENLSLGEGGKINLAGNLLFGKNPQRLAPDAYVTAIWFHGLEIASTRYHISENIGGDLARVFKDSQKFVMGCLRKVQNGKDFNSLGDPEIPEVVINELLINALIHRDYFIHDSIKVFVFDDRIEIKSPGRLPNSLTTDQIKAGISRRRNHILASYALDVLPYRGAGSGILRALQGWPHIEFENLPEAEQFNVTIRRPPFDFF